jgi:hypothetical protein
MAIIVASGTTLSLTTGLKTADQVTGRNQYVGKGRIQLIARESAAAGGLGIRTTLNVGGVALADDNMIPYAGTTGALSVKDHMVIDQVVAGGRVELFFRNDAAGTLTVDYLLLFTPM